MGGVKRIMREIDRRKKGQMGRVPDMKESFVFRDPWSRLNVKPAKIMQVSKSRSLFKIATIFTI